MSEFRSNLSAPGVDSIERLAQRGRILAALGVRLGGATTLRRAAETILEAADELLGWDACAVDLYSAERDTVTCLLAKDVIDAQRREVTPPPQELPPSAKLRQILTEGAQLLLRDGKPTLAPDTTPFGDTRRPSASLLFVPLRCEKRVTGVLTIQSYTPKAYSEEDLATLQALADHCAGAMARIQAQTLLQRTEELYRRAIGAAGAVPYAYDYHSRSYLFMGEGIEKLIGYCAKEINADLWLRIIQDSVMAGETVGLDKQEAARRVVDGQIRLWRCDMRVLTRDGQSRWISDVSVQNLDDAGRPLSSMGILEDITERKQAELAALALSKLGQGLLAAATPRAVATSVAQVAEELFGWDACSFQLYSAEKNLALPVLYMDLLEGHKVEIESPATGARPTPVDQRVIDRGPELILRDASTLALDPDAIPYGDKSRPSASIMRVPLRLANHRVTGVLAFHSYTLQAYSQKDLNALQTLADCCVVALERLWADEALRQLHHQLLEVSRQAGMAEVATSVLHNVGNVLNSVNVSTSLVASRVRASKIVNLTKVAELLRDHAADLALFLTQDPKGRKLPSYLGTLAAHLTREREQILDELRSLGANVEHIKEIVAMQQSYARVCGVVEPLALADLVEDALRLNAGPIERHQLQVIRHFTPVPPLPLDRHKVLQILVNLIRNAQHALDERGHADKQLTLGIETTDHQTVKISVADNGVGIAPENLTRIFEHGFTTRKRGHGFGLHNGALAAHEMGGSLSAQSDGLGRGATFTLELPAGGHPPEILPPLTIHRFTHSLTSPVP